MSNTQYFIRSSGYSGNSLIWWRPNSQGYTTDLNKAGRYSKEEAKSIVLRAEGQAWAYEVDKVLNCKGLFMTIHSDYLLKDDACIRFIK